MNAPAHIKDGVTFICARCTEEFIIAKGQIPPGWNDNGAIAYCADCAPPPPMPAPKDCAGKERGTMFRLRSGYMIDLADPNYAGVRIRDIAAGVSRICRFNGQIYGYYPVAQHLIIGSHICPREIAYEFLMHDGVEAIMGDVTSPLKQLLPDYKKLEAMHEKRFDSRFHIRSDRHDQVKRYDLIMLAAENLAVRNLPEKQAFKCIGAADYPKARLAAGMINGSLAKGYEVPFMERFFELAPGLALKAEGALT